MKRRLFYIIRIYPVFYDLLEIRHAVHDDFSKGIISGMSGKNCAVYGEAIRNEAKM